MRDEFLLTCIQQYRERLVYDDNFNVFAIKQKKFFQRYEMYKNFFRYASKYEKKWKRLLNRYERINIIGIQFVSLGETIPRLFLVMKDMEEDTKKTLNVILPTFFEHYTGGMYNKRIFELFEKKLYFIKESNIDFWTYVIIKHAETLNRKMFHKYYARRPEVFPVSLGKPLIPFTEKQVHEAELKMEQMGIKGEFICLHARENRVKELTFISNIADDTSCRDCDINSYLKAGLYLEKLGYQLVRMGKYESNKCNIPQVIDYANDFYDEFMDFYLVAKCKFMIGSDAGLPVIVGFWGKPVLYTNIMVLCYGLESCANIGLDMYIPKKFWSEEKNRYLNLYEVLDVSNECDIYNSRYAKKKIIYENNSEEEIYEAAMEMNARLEGRWVITEEEEEDRRKYWIIMNSWEKKHSYVLPRRKCKGYTMVFWEISYSYLKNNKYLLDVDSSLLE